LIPSIRLTAEPNPLRGAVISRDTAPRPPAELPVDDDRLPASLPACLAGDVGYLLARAGGRAIRELNRALQPFGLRSRHYTVLLVAAESGGRSQRELSDLLAIDPSAVVAIVDDLARSGLVRREPHPDDRRTRLVVLTDTGRARVEQCQALAREVGDGLQVGLTTAERALLLDLLQRVAGSEVP
jgi:DNA-binding MarR family transcriptional regulator